MAQLSEEQQKMMNQLFAAFVEWHNRKYAAPAPPFVKQIVLVRNSVPAATWIETGTYLGDTTELLSHFASVVYSIEPEPTLYDRAVARFRTFKNVNLLKGLSETILPTLLPELMGNVNFWLDGHYSAGITFKGPRDTPIAEELSAIAKNLARFQQVTVLVDDVRCFNPRNPEYATYPTPDFLVQWANEHRFTWHIEHDIFVAKNY